MSLSVVQVWPLTTKRLRATWGTSIKTNHRNSCWTTNITRTLTGRKLLTSSELKTPQTNVISLAWERSSQTWFGDTLLSIWRSRFSFKRSTIPDTNCKMRHLQNWLTMSQSFQTKIRCKKFMKSWYTETHPETHWRRCLGGTWGFSLK